LRSLRRDAVGGGDEDGDEYAGIDIIRLRGVGVGRGAVSSSGSHEAVVRRILSVSALGTHLRKMQK
jgi:hypothetical protein